MKMLRNNLEVNVRVVISQQCVAMIRTIESVVTLNYGT